MAWKAVRASKTGVHFLTPERYQIKKVSKVLGTTVLIRKMLFAVEKGLTPFRSRTLARNIVNVLS